MLSRAGLYGTRVTVHQADPGRTPYPDYFADLVVSAASLADVLRRFLAHGGELGKLHESVAIQLNDTHPAIAGPELVRLLVDQHEHVVAPGQERVVCLFESPEGPNMGRVFTVAQGAEIREGRLVVVDEDCTSTVTTVPVPMLRIAPRTVPS